MRLMQHVAKSACAIYMTLIFPAVAEVVAAGRGYLEEVQPEFLLLEMVVAALLAVLLPLLQEIHVHIHQNK